MLFVGYLAIFFSVNPRVPAFTRRADDMAPAGAFSSFTGSSLASKFILLRGMLCLIDEGKALALVGLDFDFNPPGLFADAIHIAANQPLLQWGSRCNGW